MLYALCPMPYPERIPPDALILFLCSLWHLWFSLLQWLQKTHSPCLNDFLYLNFHRISFKKIGGKTHVHYYS